MELEELKQNWDELSLEVEKQKKLTKGLVLQMAHQKLKSGIKPLIYLEGIGGLTFGIVLLAFVLLNFHKLDSNILKICGLGSIFIFTVSMYFSVMFINNSRKVDLLNNSIANTKLAFEKMEHFLIQSKKYTVWLAPLIVIFFLPVTLKLVADVDPFEKVDKLGMGLLASLILAIPVLFLLFKFYKNRMQKAKEGMNDLNEIN